MVSFRGQKKAWATLRSVSFLGLIQNFQRASPPLSCAESLPPQQWSACKHLQVLIHKSSAVNMREICFLDTEETRRTSQYLRKTWEAPWSGCILASRTTMKMVCVKVK